MVGPVPLHWMEQDSNNLKITASPSLTMYLSLSNPGTAPVNDHEHTKIVRIVVYKGKFYACACTDTNDMIFLSQPDTEGSI